VNFSVFSRPEAPAAERAPRVRVAASSERGSASRSASTYRELPEFARLPRVQSAAGHRPALQRIGGRHSECTNGASSVSPGLARQRQDYPGLNEHFSHDPEGVGSLRPHRNAATTPLGLLNHFVPLTQGSFATLGWRTESLWDSYWTATAKRSGDGAFARTKATRIYGSHRPLEKRVAASLAPALQDTPGSRHDSPI
jgi:hypothetical protein